MNSPLEQIAGLAGLVWLFLLPILLLSRLFRNCRKGKKRPRREAIRWTVQTASVVMTLVALTFVAIYTVLSWVATWGIWIGLGLALILLVVLLFGPNVFKPNDSGKRGATPV